MRTGRAMLRSLAALLVLAVLPGLTAQEKLVVVGPEPATLRLGDTARAEIRIEDSAGTPRQFDVPTVDGLQVQLFGPSQQFHQVMDGRSIVTRRSLAWSLELRPTREGTFVVPSFPIWTGTKQQATRELRLDVKKDLHGEQLGYLEVTVEPRRVYVHEPIRVHVEAGVQQGLRLVQGAIDTRRHGRQSGYDVEVQASWLEEFPGGETIATPVPAGETTWILTRGEGSLPVAFDADHERGGERWRRFSFDRAFLPTRIGKITLAAPTFRYHVVRQQGSRDLFGLGRGGVTEQYYAYGKPVEIEVLPIPEAGRPSPFFGAVGRFTIEAALDRETVRVGASVKLTLTVRGQGNLEFLRLPALDDLSGFHKLGQAEARRDADKVVVTYDLVPLTVDVREVPAIAWNFFDTTPGTEAFVEVATKPLPLAVQPLPNGETLAPLPDAAAKAVTPGVDDIFDLPSFDGPAAVAAPTAPWLVWVAIVAPWVLVGALAFVRARTARARADVAGRRARAAARTFAAALQRGDALAAFADYLADRLGVAAAAVIAPDLAERLRAAGVDDELAAAVTALVDRGTAARYGGGGGLLPDEVRALVARLEGRRFGVHGWLPFLLLPLLVAGTAIAPLAAQQPVVASDGVTLYRAGDYAAAEAAFARAQAATGDRRFLQARGNCFFRTGDLPRALWAYESTRRSRPRDDELLANIALVRARLELPDGDAGFLAGLDRARQRLTAREQLAVAGLCMLLAAGCLVFGWRRIGLRWVGALVVLPGVWFALGPLAMDGPGTTAIALAKLVLTSEPRVGLEPVATVRPGVAVTVLGGSEGAFVRVQAGDRTGYVERSTIAVVE